MDSKSPKVILCATDFSEPSRLALDEAIELARRYGLSSLRLINVGLSIEPLVPDGTMSAGYGAEITKMQEAESAALLTLAQATSRECGLQIVPEYHFGPTVDVIVRRARETGADLLVIGTHGRTGLKRLFLGSVAENILRHAPCTVVAVRAKESA